MHFTLCCLNISIPSFNKYHNLSIIDLVFCTTSKYPLSNSKNVVSLVEMRTLPFTF